MKSIIMNETTRKENLQKVKLKFQLKQYEIESSVCILWKSIEQKIIKKKKKKSLNKLNAKCQK